MKSIWWHTGRRMVGGILTVIMLSGIVPLDNATAQTLPPREQILAKLKLANDHFMANWPDPCNSCLPGKRPSNIWTRAVYYEGALAYARIAGDSAAIGHAVQWGAFHKWNFRGGVSATNADDQCAGQSYVELYELDKDAQRIANAKSCIDHMVTTTSTSYWTWIDALQMAMPLFAKIAAVYETGTYGNRMYELYNHTKTTLALYNTTDHLWWRDASFRNAKSPAGKPVYWSRGNGWVFAALARVLDVLPVSDTHRQEYLAVFRDMAAAIKAVQRSDGFWNENLADPAHFGGPEVTGTGLFTYGMAWGINNDVLNKEEYFPVIMRAWNAIADSAIFPTGAIGYVQGTGDSPGDNGSGVTNVTPSRTMNPDFDDFGLGCVLLAGSEIAYLAGALTAANQRWSRPVPAATTGSAVLIHCGRKTRFPVSLHGTFPTMSAFDLNGRRTNRLYDRQADSPSRIILFRE